MKETERERDAVADERPTGVHFLTDEVHAKLVSEFDQNCEFAE